MRIKKAIAFALSFALGACLFTGCSKDTTGEDIGGVNPGGDNSINTPSGEYTITFDANGGTFGTNSTVTCTTSGGKLNISDVPSNPTRSGYEFDVWTDASGNLFSLATSYTANTTYKAQWTGEGSGDDNNDGDDDDNEYGYGDDDDYGYGDSSDVTFIFSTGWPDAITDVRIHIWVSEDVSYTDWNSDNDIGGEYMTDNYDGTYSYTVTLDDRGDIYGLLIIFTQEGKYWHAKSNDYIGYFEAGETYNLTWSDWTSKDEIVWEGDDAWGIIPFDLV